MTPTDIEDLFHRLRDGIGVDAPPVAAVLKAGKANNRRRRAAIALASILSAAVVVGVAVWQLPLVQRSDLQPATTTTLGAQLPWESGGVLHVGDLQVRVGQPEWLAQVPGGAVFTAEDGDVNWVHSDGSIDTIGHKNSYVVVSDPQTGWVSWVEGTVDSHPELVVYDTQKPEVIGRQSLPYHGPRWQVLDYGGIPIAIDGGVVYYATENGDYRWDINAATDPQKISDAHTYVLDHQSGVQIVEPFHEPQGYGDIVIQRPGQPDRTIAVRDYMARLSPDGNYLITTQGSALAADSYVHIYDTHTGQQVPTGLPTGLAVDSAAFDADNNIVVAGTMNPPKPLTRQEEEQNGINIPRFHTPLDLIRCSPITATCTTTAPSAAPDLVQLPR